MSNNRYRSMKTQSIDDIADILTDTEERMAFVEWDLMEALSEIERHHDLIVKLRDGLAWALGYIDDAVVGLASDDTYDHLEALRFLLDRDVG